MGLVNVFGSGLATVLMDRAGRRPLLLVSHAGMGACLAALSAAFLVPGEVMMPSLCAVTSGTAAREMRAACCLHAVSPRSTTVDSNALCTARTRMVLAKLAL